MSDSKPRMKLYHFPVCPFSRKARMVLREKELVAELIAVEPWKDDSEALELNPAGEVPVLVDGSRVICDSSAIAAYLDHKRATPPLMGTNSDMRWEVMRLVAWFDSKFAREVTWPLWYEKLIKRHSRKDIPDSRKMREGIAACRQHLQYISYLYEEHSWLAGPQMTLADITAAAHLSVIDFLGDVRWHEAEGAREWYGKMKSRPSFRPLLADAIRGFSPPKHYSDLDF